MIIAMLVGLFVSRAIVSISSIALFLVFLATPKRQEDWVQTFAGTGLLLLPVLLSGLWSNDTAEWWRAVEVKLPLLTIGLAIAVAKISSRTYTVVSIVLLGLTTLGTLWSTWQYLQHTNEILAGYLQARVMPTPLNNDHIRFSWLVVLAVIVALYGARNSVKWLRILVWILCSWLVVYLHLLSAKTGLLCLYLSAFVFAVHLLGSKRNRKWSVLILAFAIAAPLLAYAALPSFRNRVQYVLYDFSHYSKGNYLSGLSDGARVLSIKSGWAITKQHPATGVGFGDMKPAIDNWHQQYYPHTQPFERFLPLNEWLLYGAGSGIPGILLFTLGLYLLCKPVWRNGVAGKITALVLLVPLVTDDTLESQFGVVIFIFVLMWIRLHQHQKVSPAT